MTNTIKTGVGDRVRLTGTDDPILRVGMTGTVEFVHVDLYQREVILVKWDEPTRGSEACLVMRLNDTWEILP